MEFIEDEATLLDDNALMEWLQCFTEDLVYRMPVRSTRDRNEGSEFAETMFHFDEDYMTLTVKASRIALTPSAWAEEPPSRTRRFITNIRAFRFPEGGEIDYEVRCSLLLMRNRYQESRMEMLSVRRTDWIRRTDDGLKIARRTIFADQATIGMQNLAVFL